MTLAHKKIPAAGQGNEDQMSSIPHHTITEESTTTEGRILRRKRRRLIVHQIINREEVRVGRDGHWRALCGHTFPVRYGIPTPPASDPQYVPCRRCADVQHIEASLAGMDDAADRAMFLVTLLRDRIREMEGEDQ